MAANTKTASKRKIGEYIALSVFLLLWLIIFWLVEWGRSFDYGWDHIALNISSAVSPKGNRITKFASEKVMIAAIDDDSLSEYGWPIPRNYYGDLVTQLNKYGAKGIVFDVIVTKSKQDRDSDNVRFVEAVRKAHNVANLIIHDKDNVNYVYPVKGLAESSELVCQPHVEAFIDGDGQIRRYAPFWVRMNPETNLYDKFITYNDVKLSNLRIGKDFLSLPVPSIGIAGLSFYTGEHISRLALEYSDPRILAYRKLAVRQKHPGWGRADTGTTTSSYRYLSFVDILKGRLSKEEVDAIKGGIILVGSTAVGAFDHSPSPFSEQMPGVEVHATFIDNALTGDFRRSLGEGWITLLILLLPWLPVMLRKYSIALIVSVCSGMLALLAGGYFLLLANNILMPFASVSLPLFLVFAYVTVDKGLSESREKKWIKGTFGQYLSPKVVELVTKDPSKLSLGGEKRDMTAFFLDLAGFTTMSEKLSPEELTAMLVEYLSAFTDVIMKHDGTVDKYIGDCIVAFWNAPMDQADHRKRGVLAAIDCQTEMTRLNEALTQFTIKPKCRVGVNSGPMVVGNMGSRMRLSYTVMGDSVNMASRMEGANKFFHSKIMTSEYTFDGIKDDFDYRYLGSIRVVGKVIPVKVYEPFARKGEAPEDIKAMLKHYNAGQEKFYKGDFAGAAPHFKAALEAKPGDGPAEFYLQKSELFAKEPIKDWDQSFNLTEKG